MTEKITFEDVLDELMLEEPKPHYEALVRWQNRYPQYRDQLADFFATWGVQEFLAEAGVPEPDIDEEKLVKKGVDYAMEILRRQGRIIPRTEVVTLQPFDQLVLTAIYLLFGDAYVVNITERVSEMLGREVLLASTFESLDRLEQRDLILGRDADPKTEPGGKTRRYFTVTLVGERALATAKATSTVVAKALEDFA
jgi:PadR family transcriptional regulator, regulatory protein PadR